LSQYLTEEALCDNSVKSKKILVGIKKTFFTEEQHAVCRGVRGWAGVEENRLLNYIETKSYVSVLDELPITFQRHCLQFRPTHMSLNTYMYTAQQNGGVGRERGRGVRVA
jgi:hypothetical protein